MGVAALQPRAHLGTIVKTQPLNIAGLARAAAIRGRRVLPQAGCNKESIMMTFTPLEVALGLIVILFLVAGAILWLRMQHRAELQSKFGPEYSRAVKETGSERKAETVLHEREKRVASFDIRPLPRQQREDFVLAWRKLQTEFVDDPNAAVSHADILLGEVMEARGYPVSDFEQRSADLSVDHAEVVQNYRIAHGIAVRHARGEAGTEDLRQALIHYRALFDDLVNEPGSHGAQPPVPKRMKEKNRG